MPRLIVAAPDLGEPSGLLQTGCSFCRSHCRSLQFGTCSEIGLGNRMRLSTGQKAQTCIVRARNGRLSAEMTKRVRVYSKNSLGQESTPGIQNLVNTGVVNQLLHSHDVRSVTWVSHLTKAGHSELPYLIL